MATPTLSPQSGRTVARSGLRMMPTFPPSPLSFRTAGFPQYGWKAGMSDSAFPVHPSLKPAPGIRRWTPGLHLPFAHLLVRFVVPFCAGPTTPRCAALEWGSTPPQGLSLRSGFFCPGPSTLIQPHPTHSWAHRDFADNATYTRCLRCAGAPRRPTSGSELSLHVLSWHAALYVPGKIRNRVLQSDDSDMAFAKI